MYNSHGRHIGMGREERLVVGHACPRPLHGSLPRQGLAGQSLGYRTPAVAIIAPAREWLSVDVAWSPLGPPSLKFLSFTPGL